MKRGKARFRELCSMIFRRVTEINTHKKKTSDYESNSKEKTRNERFLILWNRQKNHRRKNHQLVSIDNKANNNQLQVVRDHNFSFLNLWTAKNQPFKIQNLKIILIFCSENQQDKKRLKLWSYFFIPRKHREKGEGWEADSRINQKLELFFTMMIWIRMK